MARATALKPVSGNEDFRHEGESTAPVPRLVPGPLDSARSISVAVCLVLLTQFALLAGVLGNFRWHVLKGSASYEKIADELLASGTFLTTYRPPAYSALIAALKWLSFGPEALFFAHCLLAGASSVLVFLVTEKVARSRKTALLAMVLFASHLLLQIEMISARETGLYIFLELLFFYLLARTPTTVPAFAVVGAVAGFAHLTRPNGFLLLLSLLLVLAFTWSAKGKRLSAAARALAATVAFVAVIAPWQLRMHELSGQWAIASSTSGGMNLWKGNNPYTTHVLPWLDVDDLETQAREFIPDGDLTSMEADKEFSKRAKEYAMRHPFGTITLGVKKAILFLAPLPVPWGTGEIQVDGESVHIDDFKPRKGWYLFLLQTSLIYAGIPLLIMHRRRLANTESTPFLLSVSVLMLFSIAIHSITFPETRLRLPLEVLLIVCAALGAKGARSRWALRLVRRSKT